MAAPRGNRGLQLRPGARIAPRLRRRWPVLVVLASAGLLLGLQLVDAFEDPLVEWLAGAGWVLTALAQLSWPLLVVVAMLTAAHYLAAGLAARAASGLALPIGEATRVQLAAAAANRLTPFGAGGSAVNARYFTRRGLDTGQAVAALGSLHLLGGLADLATLAMLVGAGGWFGLGGTAAGVAAVVGRVAAVGTILRSPWLWGGLVLIGVVVMALPRVRGALRPTAAVWLPVRELVRRPARLGLLLGSSATTTLVLGVAFVVSIAMVGGLPAGVSVGTLMVAFFVAGAASSVVPVPSGIIATEAALIVAAVTVGIPADQATIAVLLFRIATFWLPAMVGLAVLRPLRRAKAL